MEKIQHYSRNHNMDVIRVIAVLGLLFINIYAMWSIELLYVPPIAAPFSDSVINVLSAIFVEGRFRSLFCLLFGAGLILQSQRFAEKGFDATKLIKSRLTWLLTFGLIHGVFIWNGDILFYYALCGMFVYRYRHLETKKIINKAALFIAIGTISYAILTYFSGMEMDFTLTRESAYFTEEYQLWTSNYIEQFFYQAMFMIIYAFIFPFSGLWDLGGIMLLGMACYHSGVFERGLKQSHFIALLVAGTLITTIDVLIRVNAGPEVNLYTDVIASLSGLCFALVYLHITVKLCNNRASFAKPLQAAGKMAFTLYISQSVAMVLFFRWIAPTSILEYTRIDYIFVAIIFTAIQLVFASWYLSKFDQGPLEKIWRKLAYQHFEPSSPTPEPTPQLNERNTLL